MKFLFSALFLFPFCLSAQNATVTRQLESFDKIGISGGYDVVYLNQGNDESIVLEVSGIDPEKIETVVEHGTLKISTKKGWHSSFKAKLTINFKNLSSLASSGSSDVVIVNTLKTNKFEFASSGSGNFKGELDVKDLEIAISGSSDITLKGKADAQEIAISGSGDVDAANLKGDSAEVSISGSGDVRLGVKGKVKTAVSGSGRVTTE